VLDVSRLTGPVSYDWGEITPSGIQTAVIVELVYMEER